MHSETGFDSPQSETERLAFLLSCYDVWSASRSCRGEAGEAEAGRLQGGA